MLRSVLTARSLFRGFRFAKQKPAKEPAKEPKEVKEPKQVKKAQQPKPQGLRFKPPSPLSMQIPQYIMFTEAQTKQLKELQSKLTPYSRRKIQVMADAVLQLEYPTFLHYLVRTNPETYQLREQKQYTPEELRAFVLKMRKSEIPRPEIKKKEQPKPKAKAAEAPKPAAKDQKGKQAGGDKAAQQKGKK